MDSISLSTVAGVQACGGTAAAPLLEVDDVVVELGSGAARARILNHVSLTVRRGQTLGLVGESGSGKSTLAKTLVGNLVPASGTIRFDGRDTKGLKGTRLRTLRRQVQLIPQDPYSSLNPRRTIGQALAEAIDPRGGNPRRHSRDIAEWLERVSLPAEAATRYPHEFSGGQRQRIAIARALAVRPELIIADEITSALDLTTQADILNLLAKLRRDLETDDAVHLAQPCSGPPRQRRSRGALPRRLG
ncbi:oligopeptide ABC transporter ATPase [Arthrobacter crystallopoietes BAB-32]|uniref:Oligopeptide ABC transporter ATPase n=1 Tax=Arthrobacter crystallopoietes BAB-32 TaxID=1246476 RepID=N1V344_9MICC|nr:dipeptide/oligopeptide/nickel ABC transporter ATP-binding protein [Arthrobacter crystallopoietes]EMY32663.1 oligopeptide ABC transporter ATPase [Arthrobacter crystallopoietes BAB-32]